MPITVLHVLIVAIVSPPNSSWPIDTDSNDLCIDLNFAILNWTFSVLDSVKCAVVLSVVNSDWEVILNGGEKSSLDSFCNQSHTKTVSIVHRPQGSQLMESTVNKYHEGVLGKKRILYWHKCQKNCKKKKSTGVMMVMAEGLIWNLWQTVLIWEKKKMHCEVYKFIFGDEGYVLPHIYVKM